MSRSIPNDDEYLRSNDFDVNRYKKQLCQHSNEEAIKQNIEQLNQRLKKENGDLVNKLEKDSNLFVTLSQCISLYEREFLSFPQKINEVQSMVHEAKLYPKLQLSEIPPSPKVKDSEILKKPSYIVNAPVLYDCLVQQHKINESIDLVFSTKNKLEELSKTANYIPLVEIEDWIKRTSQSIYIDTLNRIKLLPSNSNQLLGEFQRLVKLGFEQEGLDIYIKYATKAVDERMNAVQNNGEILQYIREITEALASEIRQKVAVFLKIFKSRKSTYAPRIISWATDIIESHIPLARPELFTGNYNIVKDSIINMQSLLSQLEDIGISTLHIFDSLPTYLNKFLSDASSRHIVEIFNSIFEDNWDVSTEGIQQMLPEQYPASPSLEKYKVNILQFLQEMKHLYLPTMFYDASALLKEVVLSYSNYLTIHYKHNLPRFEDFCVILTQMAIIEQVLFPNIVNKFTEITHYYFPHETATLTAIRNTIQRFENETVKSFVRIWAQQLPRNKIRWLPKKVDPHFQQSIGFIVQFSEMLCVPQNQYCDILDMLVEYIICVVHDTGVIINTPNQLNSFDFQWEYFACSVEPFLTPKATEALKKGIQRMSNGVAEKNNIGSNEREPADKISRDVAKLIKR